MSIPTYATWDDVPDHLATKSRLREEKLKPAKNQKPAAIKMGGYGPFDLYDRREAVKVRPITAKQKAALTEARRRASLPRCERCRKKVETADNVSFSGEFTGDYWDLHRACRDELIELEKAREQANRERIERERAEVVTWMKERLATNTIIVDVHTVRILGEVIDLSILHVDGTVLFNEQFNPLANISDGAVAIHGLTTEALANKPRFSIHHERLTSVFNSAENILFYGIGHDAYCIFRTCKDHDLPPFDRIGSQLPTTDYSGDVMTQMHKFYDLDNEYYGEWRKLEPRGQRTALGDCRATLELIKRMANPEQETE